MKAQSRVSSVLAFAGTVAIAMTILACGELGPGRAESWIEVIALKPQMVACYDAWGQTTCFDARLISRQAFPCTLPSGFCPEVLAPDNTRAPLGSDRISGFTFEPGFNYTLRIIVTDSHELVMDASTRSYKLISILKKEAAE